MGCQMMYSGWKAVENAAGGRSRNTLLKWQKERGFPIKVISGKPTTTDQAINDWFDKQASEQESAYSGLSSEEISKRLVP